MPHRVLAAPKWCLTAVRVGRTCAGTWHCQDTTLAPCPGISFNAVAQGRGEKRGPARSNQQQKGTRLLSLLDLAGTGQCGVSAGVGSATTTLLFQPQAGQLRRIFQEQERSE